MVNLDGLLPPAGDEAPTPDELVDFGWPGEEPEPVAGSPEPRPLAPGEPVPVFRTDLAIGKGASGGTFEVTDPASGRHFTLYEFELSIARMLDGRRHASDVIENGVRLGIPVDLDGLQKFVRQLWRYGFIAPPGTPSPVDVTDEEHRPEREKWDEATRTLFQSGLRLVRQGRPQDAASYFQAVLNANPDNAEAAERLAEIERGETIAASPIGRRGAGSAPAGRGRPKAVLVALGALLLLGAAAALAFVIRRPAAPAPAPVVAPTLAKPPPAPPPAWRTAAVQQRAHPVLGSVAAPADGTVVWSVPTGRQVKAKERIGTLRVEVAVRGAAPIDPAAAARIRELEALAKQDPVYRDFLEKERRAAQRKRSGKAVRALPILAPEAGILALAAENKAGVVSGAEVATIVDDRAWVIDAFVDGEPPQADAACELRGDALPERIACRLDGARPQEGGSQLTVTVLAADAPWVDGSRSLRIRVAPPGTPLDPSLEPQKQETR